ncbi:DinI family protein [Enterobacter ludwigii]|jgi:hypothetical protein|nr:MULTISPECIES: DinI-like family protein [Enterobacter cloacae complex]AOT45436.1 DinI family protein [Enterobacter ludwigii]DAE59317.1 MAG TPA: DinI-like family protein [Caudoviricetes sp.]
MLLYVYTVSRGGGCVDRELNEQVMIERVEMIARLTTEGTCQERDREIALNLIAEIARGNLIRNNAFTVVFSASPVPDRIKKEASVRVNITLDKDQLIGPSVVEAFQDELTRRIRSVFPSTLVTVKKGSMTGVELQGIEREADREALDNILREVWEDESWR